MQWHTSPSAPIHHDTGGTRLSPTAKFVPTLSCDTGPGCAHAHIPQATPGRTSSTNHSWLCSHRCSPAKASDDQVLIITITKIILLSDQIIFLIVYLIWVPWFLLLLFLRVHLIRYARVPGLRDTDNRSHAPSISSDSGQQSLSSTVLITVLNLVLLLLYSFK